jgi:hypothetical protein
MNHKIPAFLAMLFIGMQANAQTNHKVQIEKKQTAITYNRKLNQTVVAIFPYGGVSLPGRWGKVDYNEENTQFFMQNADSLTLGISKLPKKRFANSGDDMNLITSYYTTEEGNSEKAGLKMNTIRVDADNKYRIWRVTGSGVDQICLIGTKKEYAYNITAYYSKYVSNEDRINMLINLFLNN